MWGCTLASAIVHLIVCVFPTHVGVYRNIHSCAGAKRPFSPRMWGCTGHANTRRLAAIVFPTHVGVYLCSSNLCLIAYSFPHACGGVPIAKLQFCNLGPFSPRMWGCTVGVGSFPVVSAVFPTHVGVYRTHPRPSSAMCTFSPRMWGCT